LVSANVLIFRNQNPITPSNFWDPFEIGGCLSKVIVMNLYTSLCCPQGIRHHIPPDLAIEKKG
jgi:hypothetical protein